MISLRAVLVALGLTALPACASSPAQPVAPGLPLRGTWLVEGQSSSATPGAQSELSKLREDRRPEAAPIQHLEASVRPTAAAPHERAAPPVHSPR